MGTRVLKVRFLHAISEVLAWYIQGTHVIWFQQLLIHLKIFGLMVNGCIFYICIESVAKLHTSLGIIQAGKEVFQVIFLIESF